MTTFGKHAHEQTFFITGEGTNKEGVHKTHNIALSYGDASRLFAALDAFLKVEQVKPLEDQLQEKDPTFRIVDGPKAPKKDLSIFPDNFHDQTELMAQPPIGEDGMEDLRSVLEDLQLAGAGSTVMRVNDEVTQPDGTVLPPAQLREKIQVVMNRGSVPVTEAERLAALEVLTRQQVPHLVEHRDLFPMPLREHLVAVLNRRIGSKSPNQDDDNQFIAGSLYAFLSGPEDFRNNRQ